MPLPLTVSCFSKVQIGFTFLVLAYPGSPGKGPLNVCVCVCVVYMIRPPGLRRQLSLQSTLVKGTRHALISNVLSVAKQTVPNEKEDKSAM